MSVGTRVREARKLAGLTQDRLAHKVGMSQSALADLESGKSKGSTMIASLAEQLNVRALWLEGGKGLRGVETDGSAECVDEADAQFGVRVKRAREAAGLTLATLAERMGVSTQGVQKWETGATSPKLSRLYMLASVLGVQVSQLVPDHPAGAIEFDGPNLRILNLARQIAAMPQPKVRALAVILEVTLY